MNAWTTLGLARTGDVGEIRRAYARKLKATDVDADPDAFIALREALNRALDEAAWAAVPEEGEDEERADGHGFAGTVESLPPPAPLDDMAAAPDDIPDTPFSILDRLLFAGEDAPPPDPDALAAAVGAVLDHPDMDHVDRSAGIENWLAETLYYSIPRSDPVIPMVVDHFRWDAQAGQWDQHWLFEDLVRRREAFDLLDRLADPRHDWHKAYLDLTSDKPTLGWNTMAHANKVSSLLMLIRQDVPAAEAWLAPHRVALWDQKLGRSVTGGLKWAMLGFWLLFIVAKIFAAIGDDSPPPTAPRPPVTIEHVFTVPDVDIDPLLADAYDQRLTLAGLGTSNPPL